MCLWSHFILFLIGKTGRIRKKVFKKPSIGVSSPARPSVSDFPFSGTCVGIRSITDTLTYERTHTHTQAHKHTINCENDLTMVRDTTARSIPSHPTHSSYTNKFTTLVDSHGCRTRGDHSIKMHHQVIFTCLYIRFPCPKSRCLGYLSSTLCTFIVFVI